ncbi:MAG: class I SAM-dependent methyltransferase [Candidatus Omnitrophica bacterium]|nr:class I SAM-dependent methyltransferase [Candidatus Omnitrophota bacterium]
MYKRFELTLKECSSPKVKTILDVGCGSGRYSVALAKVGADVTGIDFSENMLAIARELARINDVSQMCKFIKADFLAYGFKDKFDICLAIGVLEYFKDPQPLLQKMASITKDKIVLSLPVKWMLRSGIRKIRLALKNYPVYFYTRGQIENMLQKCGLNDYRIKQVDRDYFIVIDLGKRGINAS